MITPEQIFEIVELRSRGLSARKISRQMALSRSKVGKIIADPRTSLALRCRPRSAMTHPDRAGVHPSRGMTAAEIKNYQRRLERLLARVAFPKIAYARTRAGDCSAV